MGNRSGPTTTQTSGLPPELMPYLQQYGSMIQGVAQQPYEQYQGLQVAPLSGTQNNALSGINNLMGGTGSTQAAEQMLQQTLSGQGGNQFTPQVVQRATDATTRAYGDATQGITSRFNTTGNAFGVRHEMAQDRANTDLARGLGDATGQLYSNAYENERNRQMGAVGQAGGLYSTLMGGMGQALNAGGVERGYGQQLASQQEQNWNNAYNYPRSQLGLIGNAISPLLGGQFRNQSTTGPAPDNLSQGAGLALLASRLYGGSSGASTGGVNSGGKT